MARTPDEVFYDDPNYLNYVSVLRNKNCSSNVLPLLRFSIKALKIRSLSGTGAFERFTWSKQNAELGNSYESDDDTAREV
jgi:hypothetical protein